MDQPRSVSRWIDQAKTGEEAAAQRLWERYFPQLLSVARKKLSDGPRRVADEQDVVVSVFDACLRGAREGRFADLHDREDLWQILVMLTARKASNLKRAHNRQKRGGGRVRGESVFEEDGMYQVVSQEPTPETAALLAEEIQSLLDRLDDPDLKQVALWKLENYTNREIAEKLGRSTRSVIRKLNLIREIATDGE